MKILNKKIMIIGLLILGGIGIMLSLVMICIAGLIISNSSDIVFYSKLTWAYIGLGIILICGGPGIVLYKLNANIFEKKGD